MIDVLVKIAVGIGAYLFADAVTEEVTGKHIHEHVFEWWQQLHQTIQDWLHEHKEKLKVAKVMLVVLDACDGVTVRTKQFMDRITIGAYAVNQKGETVAEIAQSEVSMEEALKQFPHLAEKPVMILEA